MKILTYFAAAAIAAALVGCEQIASTNSETTTGRSGGDGTPALAPDNPYPSTYAAYPSQPTLIQNAVILDGVGGRVDNGAVLLQDGRVAAIGENIAAPDNAVIIDAAGKWVTPGVIDIHSHLGVYPTVSTSSTSDGNEATAPATPEVWAEHSVWPHDPGFSRALAGGVTSMMVLPGSANLFGGRTVVLKNVPGRTVQEMKFPGAPYGLKMACGENPKRVYESRGPATRMGNFAGYRAEWIKAQDYKRKWDEYVEKIENGEDADPPTRDLALETLKGVLEGDIRINMHCYRGDEMALVLDLAREFDYRVTTFHHAVESYKIADILAREDVCSAVWADWWGFKLEAYDHVPENAALIHNAGACVIIHSDSERGIQHLNQEAGKALADGRHIGIEISDAEAIAWITSNAARAMGVDEQTGSLEVGKMADVVVWSGNPFSVYSLAEQVFIDGALMFDRNDPARSPRSDYELGQRATENSGGAGQ